MGYRIEEVGRAETEVWQECAEFLAHFVASGEQEDPSEADAQPETWSQRFRWWWAENPFVRDDSPLALVLRQEGGTIVGFHGFIPRDYECEGTVSPGLAATTFFVREAHRGASLGVFMRVQKLGKTHHIVDTTPSPEMQVILQKFRYQKHGEGRTDSIFVFPSSSFGLFLQPLRWFQAIPGDFPEGDLVTQVEAVSEVGRPANPGIRRQVTKESLLWALRCGLYPKRFYGWLGADGKLLAWVIAEERKKAKQGILRVIDHECVDGSAMRALLHRLVSRPRVPGLPPHIVGMVWTSLDGDVLPGKTPVRLNRPQPYYYQLPASSPNQPRICRL
ncbi:MAG: hypothetical protein AAGJ31_16285, partial [Verrucomicrobiota bacterium]